MLILVLFFSATSVTGHTILVEWTDSFLISTKDNFDDHQHNILLDNNNNLHVVWREDHDFDYTVLKYRQLFANNNTWSEIALLSFMAMDVHSFSPILKKDLDGVIHLIWKYGNSADGSVFQKHRYYSEGRWSETFTLTELNITSNYFDFVPISNNDLFFIFDSKYNTSTHELYYQTYNWVTQNYSSKFQLTNSTKDFHYPCIAVDSQQAVHVSWSDITDSMHGEIHYQKIDKILPFAEPIVISQIDDFYTAESQICVDKDDNIHFLYTEINVSYFDPYFNIHYRVLSDNALGTDIILKSGETTDPDYNMFIDTKNNVHFIWHGYFFSDKSGNLTINYQQRLSTGSWSNEIQYITEAQNGGHPLHVIDSNDFMHVTWSAYIDNDWCFYYVGGNSQNQTVVFHVFLPIISVLVILVIIGTIRKRKSNLL